MAQEVSRFSNVSIAIFLDLERGRFPQLRRCKCRSQVSQSLPRSRVCCWLQDSTANLQVRRDCLLIKEGSLMWGAAIS